jgi:hypothetical protein
LTLSALEKWPGDPRLVTIMPGRLDEETADVAISGLGDRSATLSLPSGAFQRNQSEISHEPTRGLKTPEVMELGDDPNGGERVDPTETSKPRDGLAVRILQGHLRQLGIQAREPLGTLIDGEEIIFKDCLAGTILKRECAQPSHVSSAPVVLRLAIDDVASQEELTHAVACSHEIAPRVFSTAEQIP